MLENLIRKIKTSKIIPQAFKYAVVGGIATVVDMGLLYILTEFVSVFYLLSATISFLIAAVVNYSINKAWTFKNKSAKVAKQFGVFFFFAVIGAGLNLFFLYVFTEYFHLWYMYSKLIATFIVFIWNFFGNKYFTFRMFK